MIQTPNIWGRVPANKAYLTDENGNILRDELGNPLIQGGTDTTPIWQLVTPSLTGDPSYVYVVNLIQCLKLNLGESPIYSQFGIPAQRSVMTQIFPDYYVNFIQQYFSQYFASLQITKVSDPSPIYQISLLTNAGATYQGTIPV